MRYTFGTNDMAAMRLEKLAWIFNPHSADFIRKYADSPVVSALDLGCGPGFTTHMLFMALRAKEIYGFDNSEEFLDRAMDRFGHCVFVRHDISKTPFPVKPEMMYARFILSHLPNPAEQLNKWAGELKDGGILLAEETEDIQTDISAFRDYLSISKNLIASQGAKLYPGPEISAGHYDGKVIENTVFELPVANNCAAAVFYANTASIWKREDHVLDTTSPAERKRISDKLLEIMRSNDTSKNITWKLRRITIRQ